MTKVTVNSSWNKDRTPSRSRFVWASFRLEIDAHKFADELKQKPDVYSNLKYAIVE